MNDIDICNLVLPLVKTSSSLSTFNILCKVNKLFYKEFISQHNIELLYKWFHNNAPSFFRKNTCAYCVQTLLIDSSIHFMVITSERGGYEKEHSGILSYSDDNSFSMKISSEYDDDEIDDSLKFFSNIKSLKMLKRILSDDKFHPD